MTERQQALIEAAMVVCHWCGTGVPRTGTGNHAHGNSRRCFAENIWLLFGGRTLEDLGIKPAHAHSP